MKQRLLFIYVPGLGDNKLSNRQTMLAAWKLRRSKVEICTMDWATNESWSIKLQRLNEVIRARAKQGYVVNLIGESAGASAVTQAFIANTERVNSVILLCGKSQHPERVSKKLYRQYSSLEDAITRSHAVVQKLTPAQKANMLNVHPLRDPVVPVSETKITGVVNSRMPIVGHSVAIIFANIFWIGKIVRFARQKISAN